MQAQGTPRPSAFFLTATLNKQFDLNWAGSVSGSRDFSDRKDGGAVSLAVKYFF